MSERKTLTPEQIAILNKPLPPEAVKPHPTKKYLSTIKVIYLVERLNEVFGIGGWFVENAVVERVPETTNVVVESIFTAPDYGIRIPMFGGNDNPDLGDAYKGACTDALSKICSYMGLGMHVYKGMPNDGHAPEGTQPDKPKPSPAKQAPPSGEMSGVVSDFRPSDKGTWFKMDGHAVLIPYELKIDGLANGVEASLSYTEATNKKGDKYRRVVKILAVVPKDGTGIDNSDVPF